MENKVDLYVKALEKLRDCDIDSPEYSLWFDIVENVWYAMDNEERRQADILSRQLYESEED
jgi:hypothetical protein